jgi:hypothetical protein
MQRKMKFKNIENKSDEVFRRLCGVKKTTFVKMIEILTEAYNEKHKKGGRPHSLPMEERLLMALEYLREYRTYAHIGLSYNVSERCAFETIKWIEDTLSAAKEFALPGKKALLNSDNEFEVILIDASESPIERPKKNKKDSILEKRKGIQ